MLTGDEEGGRRPGGRRGGGRDLLAATAVAK
jgi:hypothetical protein